jgi:hypothetical protein
LADQRTGDSNQWEISFPDKKKRLRPEGTRLQDTAHSPARRFSDVSRSTGIPRSHRVNWWTISP